MSTEKAYTDYLPLEAYIPYCESMSHGDEDLRQELFLEAARVIARGHTYPARVIHSMKMARVAYRRGSGCSIDNGNPWRRPKWGNWTGFRYEEANNGVFDPSLVAYCSRDSNPEEIALFNISFERFLTSLTTLERSYMDDQLEGFSVCDRTAKMSRYMVTKVRTGLRQKFSEFMETGDRYIEEDGLSS